MASEFQRYAVQQLIDRARGVGVEVPDEVVSIVCGSAPNGGAMLWAKAHPDEDTYRGCCEGVVYRDAEDCTCWTPVFDVDQAPPRFPTIADGLKVQDSMCGDCAFRPDSPERADEYSAEALYRAADSGTPFWCHTGMRRPTHWVHPDGRTISGHPDDWQPLILEKIPFQADGSPGLLCAGWAARATWAARSGGDVRKEESDAD